MIPHGHFRVMLRDDKFLKAGLQGSTRLHSKRKMAEAVGGIELAKGVYGSVGETDEMDDEVVLRAMRK